MRRIELSQIFIRSSENGRRHLEVPERGLFLKSKLMERRSQSRIRGCTPTTRTRPTNNTSDKAKERKRSSTWRCTDQLHNTTTTNYDPRPTTHDPTLDTNNQTTRRDSTTNIKKQSQSRWSSTQPFCDFSGKIYKRRLLRFETSFAISLWHAGFWFEAADTQQSVDSVYRQRIDPIASPFLHER